MRRHLLLFWLTIIVMLTAVSASAAPQIFVVNLSGANEVPASGSAGTGSATVILDGAAHTLTVQISFSGLTGNTTASHIHCCTAPGVNAMVATTTPTFAGFPLGVTAGTYQNTLDLTQASSYNPAFITAHGATVTQAEADLAAGMVNGQSYLNIHTNNFPGGEIRGQLLPDTTPPTITCPGNRTTFTDSGQVFATVIPGTPTATDNVSVLSVTGVRSDGKPLNDPYPLGLTVITWKATDSSGNSSTCGQSITVLFPSPNRRKP